MRGIFEYLKANWPQQIAHKHKDGSEKEVRYAVGQERLLLLRHHAERFAYKVEEEVEYVAFLHCVEEGDLDYRMPSSTKVEYICGKREGNASILFAYIWFDSILKAKQYATDKGMRIEGGWNER